MSETLAPATIRRVYVIIHAALEQAVKWGWLAVNPADASLPPKIRQTAIAHLADFVGSYCPEDRRNRQACERFRRFTYQELVQRDKASLDLFRLRDGSLEDTDNLPAPEIIAAEIVEDLEAALAQFAEIAASLSSDPEATG